MYLLMTTIANAKVAVDTVYARITEMAANHGALHRAQRPVRRVELTKGCWAFGSIVMYLLTSMIVNAEVAVDTVYARITGMASHHGA
jgi:hypothetical protein